MISLFQEYMRIGKDEEVEAFNNAIKDPDISFSVHAGAAGLIREAKASLERLAKWQSSKP